MYISVASSQRSHFLSPQALLLLFPPQSPCRTKLSTASSSWPRGESAAGREFQTRKFSVSDKPCFRGKRHHSHEKPTRIRSSRGLLPARITGRAPPSAWGHRWETATASAPPTG